MQYDGQVLSHRFRYVTPIEEFMNPAKPKSDGSYLSSLASMAVNLDVPVALSGDIEGYKKARKDLFSMVEFLKRDPQMQEQIAFLFDFVPSKWLLGQEIPVVVARRKKHEIASEYIGGDPYDWARGQNLQGLCVSGGGIRSATFNLGILQGLAEKKMLHRFDYLSSVSGGGYIHEWLAGWIKREEAAASAAAAKLPPQPDECETVPVRGGVAAARGGLGRVQNRMQPLPAGQQLPFQPEEIRWLRRYSNYLTPQKGFFTADTWVLVAIWLRNTFLNQLILASALFFLVLVPHVASHLIHLLPRGAGWWASVVSFGVATAGMWWTLHNEYERVRQLDMYGPASQPQAARRTGGEMTVQLLIVTPMLLAALLFLASAGCGKVGPWLLSVVTAVLTVMVAGLAFGGGAVRTYKTNHGMIAGHDKMRAANTPAAWIRVSSFVRGCWQIAWRFVSGGKSDVSAHETNAREVLRVFVSAILFTGLLNSLIAGAAGAGALMVVCALLKIPVSGLPAFNHLTLPTSLHSPVDSQMKWRVQLTLGPPLLLFVPFFSMVIAAGLVGRNYPDWLREWLARVRAWSMLFGIGWLVYVGISLLGPPLFAGFAYASQHGYAKLAPTIKWSSVVVWLATTAGSVMAGNSKKATGTPKDSSPRLNLLADVGPYVFILGLLVALARVADLGFRSAFMDLKCGNPIPTCLLLVLPLAIFGLFGWRVDINDFSMNPFYRNRLTRCYLGASNRQRDPNPLTGFDDRDSRGMQISRLKPDPDPTKSYSGPLPIICTTINLTFGEDLAWQERKAASFFFSFLYSGYTVGWTSGKAGGKPLSFNGFVPTEDYYNPDGGIDISTAVAISGAAASPNSGYHTNPATAFLMTVFNVRLGWWILNPRRSQLAGCLPMPSAQEKPEAAKEWPSPRFAPIELGKELLGMTDDTSKFVYLSDGGHFDNMGLYELVRRRCYKIVICDAEADENYIFEGIGMAIRKCRIDFGVEITLDKMSGLRPDKKTGNCQAHFAQGTIRYPETPPGKENEGKILYIKSSLTGSIPWETLDPPEKRVLDAEPVDILNYKLQHASFPHDTTANQWFTESQFESYRRLGQHVAKEIKECGAWASFV
jgi:hypothetical protein